MISYGYILVDSYIISLNLNCIMQLKQFYNIATKVSSRKKCYHFWWSTWLFIAPFQSNGDWVFLGIGPMSTLQWRHNKRNGVSNIRRLDCLLNCVFRRRSQKTLKLRITALCWGIYRWLRHSWTLLANHFTCDQDTVIHSNPYIILYVFYVKNI